ncbi:MAG: MBL fold metallo-hydrolase, partial [Planctomycetota bacterium]
MRDPPPMGIEIDFLAVGENSKSGDAIALRFGDLHNGDPSSHVVGVIDGGYQQPGKELVAHIRRYYQRNDVDFVLSTHPDSDHTNGLMVLLDEMPVGTLLMH